MDTAIKLSRVRPPLTVFAAREVLEISRRGVGYEYPVCDLYIFLRVWKGGDIEILYVGQADPAVDYWAGFGAWGRVYNHLLGSGKSQIDRFLAAQGLDKVFVLFLQSFVFYDPVNSEMALIERLKPGFNRNNGARMYAQSRTWMRRKNKSGFACDHSRRI